MKKISAFVAAVLLLTPFSPARARAGSVETRFVVDRGEEKTPLDLFSFDSSYVFGSKISNGAEFDDQSAWEFEGEYSHRFHLAGKWYLRAGLNYNRFDFSETNAPVPDHLQSLGALISLEYMVGADRGAFLELRPGFYGQDDFRSEAFDILITIGRAWVLKQDSVYFFTGVNAAFLRGEFPVLPLVGLVWVINEQWLLYGVVPEPRLICMPNNRLDLWVGGQITGGSFRTNRDDSIVPQKLSNAQVDYSDYRAGAGFTWHANKRIDFELGGGYSIQRRFNFERAGEDYSSDPAPYVKVALKAEF